jgi:hypothetical protein
MLLKFWKKWSEEFSGLQVAGSPFAGFAPCCIMPSSFCLFPPRLCVSVANKNVRPESFFQKVLENFSTRA